MKLATKVILQVFANPFLINILVEDMEIKMKLSHGNCFHGCVESVEQEEGIWKVFFRLFLSRLVSLSSQVDAQWTAPVARGLVKLADSPACYPAQGSKLLKFL